MSWYWHRATHGWRRTVLLVDATILLLAFVFWRLPIVEVEAIDYFGPEDLRSEMMSRIAIPADSNWLAIDPGRVTQNVIQDGQVVAARARLSFPNRLRIEAAAREPVLWLAGEQVGGIDNSGALMSGAESPRWRLDMGVPIFAGVDVQFNENRVSAGGIEVPFQPYCRIASWWSLMCSAEGRLQSHVSEIVPMSERSYELILYGKGDRIVMPVGRAAVRGPRLGWVLSHVAQNDDKRAEWDLRYERIVICRASG